MNPKRELFLLTGSDDTTTGVPDRYLSLDTTAPVDPLPASEMLASAQINAAIHRIHEATETYPRYPWASLARLAGPMCPEDLIIVAARTGGGKSLFLQNLWDALICAGRYGLYVGLEQGPEILRIKWACLRQGVSPRLALAPEPEEQGSPQWDRAMALIQQDLAWQKTPEIIARAHFSSARKINSRGLRRWTEWAVEHGAQFVIVDHIDRVDHGDGKNSFHELSETIRDAKELARKNRLVMILASQVGRPHDKLEQFSPPTLSELRGAGTKEEESDTVLGIYRPFRADVTTQELRDVRNNLRDRDTIIEPNVMGVQVLKHRLDGPVAGKGVKLAVKHQRVTEMSEADRWTTEGHYPKQIV